MISIHTDRLSDMMNITLSAVNLECKKKSFYTMRKKTLAQMIMHTVLYSLSSLNFIISIWVRLECVLIYRCFLALCCQNGVIRKQIASWKAWKMVSTHFSEQGCNHKVRKHCCLKFLKKILKTPLPLLDCINDFVKWTKPKSTQTSLKKELIFLS